MENNFNKLRDYFKAEAYLNQGLIRASVPDIPEKITRRELMLDFLKDLGHPEQTFPSIHVAGTSGKGSTCIMIAEILRNAGYNVGLHMTPYLQVATEKLWYNGQYASMEEFTELVEWIKPICKKWRSPHIPIHGLASFGICLEYFRRKKCDIAVIETGVGGRNDITNVLNTLISVITPLGIDHIVTLGSTIESIAHHKAGIIKKSTPVIACKGAGFNVLEKEAQKMGASITWVDEQMDPRVKPEDDKAMPGRFQSTNANIAKNTCMKLSELGFDISDHDIHEGISKARIPGRMEILQREPTVIIDGAHNFQKLENLFQEYKTKEIILIFGMLASKISCKIIELIKKSTNRIILTQPQVYGKKSYDLEELYKKINSEQVKIIPDAMQALEACLNMAKKDDTILVTGSLYLAGNIREKYFPSKHVLDTRSSW